ncbi:hypothetical protein HaLaN_07776, partial [Haematococcus lacustris]
MSTCTCKGCSRPSAPDYKTCQFHLDYHRRWRKQQQEKLAAIQAETGVQLCVHCSKGIKPGSRAVAAAFGKKGCEPCLAALRLRTAASKEEVGEAYASWVAHKSTVTQRYAAGLWLTLSLFTDLMYPFGPKGPRATCDELKPDGSRCGGEGTVNRIFSGIKSYRPEDYQMSAATQLCNEDDEDHHRIHPGNASHPGTLATAEH